MLFITMVQQLSAPLNYFGSFYRQIQGYVIDMSNMFDLLATSASIQVRQPSALPRNRRCL